MNAVITVLQVVCVLGLLIFPRPGAWAGLVGLLGLAAVRWWVTGRPVPKSPLDLPILLFLAGALVGAGVTVAVRGAGVRLFDIIAAVASFYLVLDRVRRPDRIRRGLWTLLLALLIAMPLAFIALRPVSRMSPGAGHFDPTPGSAGGARRALWFPHTGKLRALADALGVEDLARRYALTSAGLGMLTACGVGLSLGPLLEGAGARVRLLGLLSLLYASVFLAASDSRTAWLAAALTCLLFVARRHRTVLVVGLLVIITLGAVVAFTCSRATADGQGRLGFACEGVMSVATIRHRIELWRNAWFLARDFPFTGAGLGHQSVAAVYNGYFEPRRFCFLHSHNIFVQTHLEQGLLGLLGLAGMVVASVVVGRRALARALPASLRPVALSAAAGALTLALCGLTELIPFSMVGLILLFGLLGILTGVAGDDAASAPSTRGDAAPWPRLTRFVVPAAVLAAVLIALVPLGLAPRGVPAAFYRNLGALEIAHATLASESPEDMQRDLERAERHLGHTRELLPADPSAYRLLAAVAVARADPKTALGLVQAAEARAAPGDSHLRFQLGRLYRDAGATDRAIETWSHVDRRVGARTGAGPDSQLITWGNELVAREQWVDAVKVNRAAIQAAPTNPEPYWALAAALARAEGEAAAMSAMQALSAQKPHVPWPHEMVAELYLRRGNTDQARIWDQRARGILASTEWKEIQRPAFAAGYFQFQPSPRSAESGLGVPPCLGIGAAGARRR